MGTYRFKAGRFEALEKGVVTVRPIAGTRRRGHSEEEDLALEQDLLADPKEIAEHLMLIDLGRNDVGRIADIGSVELTDKMVVEAAERDEPAWKDDCVEVFIRSNREPKLWGQLVINPA